MDKQRKKEIVYEYKQQKPVGGVYRIYNTISGNSLIKADSNIRGFENRFSFSKKTNSCVILQLQEEWKRYGAASFEMEILEEIKMKEDESPKQFKDRLKEREEDLKASYNELR